MAKLVGRLDRLSAARWGVRRVYGYPGDGINGIMGALTARRTTRSSSSSRCATRRWRPSWPAPTPSSPARSACAWRRPGPGAIHLLNGLYDAKLDHQPVVAIVGQQARAAWAATTSRRSTSTRCSRTWRTSTCSMAIDARRRCATWSTAPSGSRWPSAPSTCMIVPERRAGAGRRRGAAARSTARCTRASATRTPRVVPRRADLRARRRDPERRRAGGDAGRRGRAAAPATR